ncbi:MAG TPA: rhomboid family intramembrane serine protease [Opitutaceae bacterium]
MLPLWDTQPHKRPPVVTVLLIAANLGVFGYEVVLALQGSRGAEAFLVEFALVPQRLLGGWTDERQWLTVLTAMFLHGGVAHVVGNCWFLWIFGNNVEDRLGHFLFLLFYLASGFGAAALQVLFDPSSAVPMIGASGAISGVLGAYFILFPTAWVVALVPWIVPVLPVPAFVFLILWFAIQALNGVGSLLSGASGEGGVAWWAHAGGFAAGVALLLGARNLGWVRKK